MGSKNNALCSTASEWLKPQLLESAPSSNLHHPVLPWRGVSLNLPAALILHLLSGNNAQIIKLARGQIQWDNI